MLPSKQSGAALKEELAASGVAGEWLEGIDAVSCASHDLISLRLLEPAPGAGCEEMITDQHSFCTASGGLITTHFIELMKGETTGIEYARPETFAVPWREEDYVDGKEFK